MANVQTLTGNTGGAVPPTGNNINVVGDGSTITIAGNPGTSTLTASVIADYVDTINGNTGSATPTAGIVAIVGTGSISTSATGSTLTISSSGGSGI